MKNKTIHQSAREYLCIYRGRVEGWQEDHPKCPRWIAQKIIAAKKRANLKRAAHDALYPRWPDRGLNAETLSRRNKRRSEMATIIRGLLALTHLRGQPLARLAHEVRQKRYSWGVDYAALDALADSDLGGKVGWIRANRCSPDTDYYRWSEKLAEHHHPGQGIQCLLLIAVTAAISTDYIGSDEAEREISRLAADPAANISGYLASSILSWQRGVDGYERCSGGESKLYFRTRPDLWDYLLSRAPSGSATKTAIQVLPHEAAKAKACQEAGLFEVFRMNDSIYTGSEQQITGVLAKIA